ncbi:cytochrome c oxidase assembly protein [Promicromonospora vindobonensis]|uniref:Cytochrome c oxidase assembly protein n=1 Tax=Promicromonospora vindobonensis TaxID=195748 RepID=A0ABW5VTY0_9MICO
MIGVDEHLHGGSTSGATVEWVFLVPFLLAAGVYLAAVASDIRQGRTWPWYRSLMWVLGVMAAAAGFVGPLATAAHDSFTAHMGAHLVVGMVAPLLLVLAAPVTLALRVMDVKPARVLSRVLHCPVGRVLTNPVVAALLNVGGLCVLYRGPLYGLMQQGMLVHVLVMVHFLLAGYLYTVSLVPVDPSPHRTGFVLRAVVLVVSLAAHGVLAKLLYAYPPPDVTTADAHTGAQLMFYGGDLVDFVLIWLLCAQWYRVTGRQLPTAPTTAVAQP